jgi:hypothetical protein
MSCCGSRTAGAQFRSASHSSSAPSTLATGQMDTLFEYRGATSLTVTGPVTGRSYRFEKHGARRLVSLHDAASLLHIPSLKAVRRS